MPLDDEFDEPVRSPADPPFGDDGAIGELTAGAWWRKLDVVHALGLVLAVVALALLIVIAVQRLLA
jgi:hypothetical protein